METVRDNFFRQKSLQIENERLSWQRLLIKNILYDWIEHRDSEAQSFFIFAQDLCSSVSLCSILNFRKLACFSFRGELWEVRDERILLSTSLLMLLFQAFHLFSYLSPLLGRICNPTNMEYQDLQSEKSLSEIMLIALKMLLLRVDGFFASKANKFERNSDQADNMCFRFFR